MRNRSRSRLATFALAVLATLVWVPGMVSTASAAGTQISYVVMPHPDDEWEGWSLIANAASNNKVFIYGTAGDESSACNKTTDGPTAGGPYWYQGPSSPVGEPDYAETLPVNPPWGPTGGKSSTACVDSRRGATRQFLIDRAATDPYLPNFSTTPTTKCFSGNTRAGIPPQRQDFGGTPYTSNCALVYPSTNGYGTLVFFDMGDKDLTAEEVEWAVLAVKNNKAYVGVPSLPEGNAVSSYYNVNYGGACQYYDHVDHHAIHVALWNWSMGIPVRWGRSCSLDPDAQATTGRHTDVPLTDQTSNFAMAGNVRVGPAQQRYGWLDPDYWGTDFTGPDKGFAQTQWFWGRR